MLWLRKNAPTKRSLLEKGRESTPTESVAGLVDVIDETKELSYIDEDTSVETAKKESFELKILEYQNEFAMGPGENSGLKAHDPIDLDPSKAEGTAAGQSHLPPPVLGDVSESTAEATGEGATQLNKETNILQLEKAGAFS